MAQQSTLREIYRVGRVTKSILNEFDSETVDLALRWLEHTHSHNENLPFYMQFWSDGFGHQWAVNASFRNFMHKFLAIKKNGDEAAYGIMHNL